MTTWASTTPQAEVDGVTYASSVVLPSTNADNDLLSPAAPVSIVYHQAVVANVVLVVAGGPATNSTFVALQTDLGDNNWYDLAWCLLTSVANGTYLFLLAAGVAGANAIQQTRAAGTAPGSSGSAQRALGSRIRFAGRSVLTGGTAPGVTASVKYRLLALR